MANLTTMLYPVSAAITNTLSATIINLPPILDKIDGTNDRLDDLKISNSSINSYTSQTATELTALKNTITNQILSELGLIKSYTFVGTNSNVPLYVNQGTLTYLADSVSIDTGNKRRSNSSLSSSLRVLSAGGLVYNIFGISTASIDQYIQLYDIAGTGVNPSGTPIGVFLVPANSNFSFDFNRGVPLANGLLIVNSLTPVAYNTGNDDMFITAIFNN